MESAIYDIILALVNIAFIIYVLDSLSYIKYMLKKLIKEKETK